MKTAALSGKTALVIGGSRGIGAAIVEKLTADGAAVVFTWITPSAQVEQRLADFQRAGNNVQALQADSADPAALAEAVNRAAAILGGLDILVYNAGMLKTGTIDDFSLSDFDPHVCCQRSWPVRGSEGRPCPSAPRRAHYHHRQHCRRKSRGAGLNGLRFDQSGGGAHGQGAGVGFSRTRHYGE
nr:2,3-dihydro-2,3-dihydroxybenzoate dehydrogenase [Raoultella sp. NCTC 9187]